MPNASANVSSISVGPTFTDGSWNYGRNKSVTDVRTTGGKSRSRGGEGPIMTARRRKANSGPRFSLAGWEATLVGGDAIAERACGRRCHRRWANENTGRAFLGVDW